MSRSAPKPGLRPQPWLLGCLGPIVLSLGPAVPCLAGPSPWWENYELEEQYRCTDDSGLLLERNASQASLYRNGYKTNLFRDQRNSLVTRYSNERLTLTVNGDEITIEDLLTRTRCHRFQQV
ncbi:MAG: hypothetical protein RLZZ158_1434 [Cyanobacteriota bacterium]